MVNSDKKFTSRVNCLVGTVDQLFAKRRGILKILKIRKDLVLSLSIILYFVFMPLTIKEILSHILALILIEMIRALVRLWA